jgi:hypothetical protein
MLCLARLSPSSSQRASARSLVASGVDWERLLPLAERQGLTLLLHRHLARAAADLCPAPVLERLASQARAIAALNMMLAGELADLLPAFSAAGCEPVVIKGPALAVSVYGDLSSRPFGDVDVVVPSSFRARACELLSSRGYVPTPFVPPRWQEAWRRSTHEQLFLREDSPLLVDLHWELTAPGYATSMTLEEVRRRLVQVALGPCSVTTLGPVDNLLFLCNHGTKHDWSALSWLVDVAELVRGQPSLDWDAVLRWSRVFGRRRPVQLGLHLAHRLLSAPVPSEVLLDGERDPEVAALVSVVSARLLDPASVSAAGLWSSMVGSVWFRGTESWSDRLRFVHEWVLTPHPPDYAWVSLPRWAGLAYYLVRPLRLLLKHRGAAVGLGRGR